MATKNDVTGDSLVTKIQSNMYDEGWERIFGKKKKEEGKEDGDNRVDETVQEQEAS